MMIHEVTAQAGKYKQRKRVGRGVGSGNGKTAGRGQKGAGSRAGNSRKYQFEGGQMPFFRRMPKFGFTNHDFKTHFWAVNMGDILASDAFKKGGEISADTLIAAGLVRDKSKNVKILGGMPDGVKVDSKFTVEVNRVTASARKLI